MCFSAHEHIFAVYLVLVVCSYCGTLSKAHPKCALQLDAHFQLVKIQLHANYF